MHAQAEVSKHVYDQSTPSQDDRQQPIKYLNFNDLRAKLGNRGRTSIYRDVELGRLPKPMKIGSRLYWNEAGVEAAIENCSAEAA